MSLIAFDNQLFVVSNTTHTVCWSPAGAELFAEELYEFLYGRGSAYRKFERWCNAIEALPRKQTRVLTWPLLTIFGFIAQPEEHIFLKPNVTQIAARHYGYDFLYRARPSWETYASLLDFAETIRQDLTDMPPRDMIDIQSFVWVRDPTSTTSNAEMSYALAMIASR